LYPGRYNLLQRAERSGVPSRKSTRLDGAVGRKHPRTLAANADAGELVAAVVTSVWATTRADSDLSCDGGCHEGEDGKDGAVLHGDGGLVKKWRKI
jgi:hypothetical protein